MAIPFHKEIRIGAYLLKQKLLGRKRYPLVLMLERPDGPEGWPKAVPVTIDLPNDHLSYAMTWYGLAVVLLAVYIVFSLTNPRPVRP